MCGGNLEPNNVAALSSCRSSSSVASVQEHFHGGVEVRIHERIFIGVDAVVSAVRAIQFQHDSREAAAVSADARRRLAADASRERDGEIALVDFRGRLVCEGEIER